MIADPTENWKKDRIKRNKNTFAIRFCFIEYPPIHIIKYLINKLICLGQNQEKLTQISHFKNLTKKKETKIPNVPIKIGKLENELRRVEF